MNTNAIAEILIKAHGDFAGVKRNPNGKPNGNSVDAVWKRTRKALIAAGETYESASEMVRDLCKRALPGHLG